jgi:hypothetical protein
MVNMLAGIPADFADHIGLHCCEDRLRFRR